MCNNTDSGARMFEFQHQFHYYRHCVLGQITELLFPRCPHSRDGDNNSAYLTGVL